MGSRVATAAAVILAMSVLPRPAVAEDRNRETVVAFDRDVEVPGKLLHPGTYIFRLLDSPSNRHIVLVLDGQRRTVAVCLTVPVQRPSAIAGTQMAFERRPESRSIAIVTWFYPWQLEGEQFLYFGRPLE